MEQTNYFEKLKVIAIITVLIFALASALFLVGFSSYTLAEAAEETATNLIGSEVNLNSVGPEGILVTTVNKILTLTKDTIYRIYVNVNGVEYVKDITCLSATEGSNVNVQDRLTLGNFGSEACYLWNTEDGSDDIAILVFANGIVQADSSFIASETQSSIILCISENVTINSAKLHAITLASDPLMSFEGESASSDTSIMEVIIDGATESVVGLAGMVLPVFQRSFMNATIVDGVTSYEGLNAYGIALCSFTGLAIAIYIFKKIIHLVRNRGLW